jgi:hypothetical protein
LPKSGRVVAWYGKLHASQRPRRAPIVAHFLCAEVKRVLRHIKTWQRSDAITRL